MFMDLLALSVAPAIFVAAWFSVTTLMRSHQPIVGHSTQRKALWGLSGALSLFWMIAVLVVGLAS
jgi:hypothetical protein